MYIFKKATILFFFFAFFISMNSYGQTINSTPLLNDSSSAYSHPKAINLVDINFELERSRKKLVKIAYELIPNPEIDKLDTLVEKQKAFMNNELKEYEQFNPYNLSKYFLENTYRAWNGYKKKSLKWNTLINTYISHAQRHIDELEYSGKVWKLTKEEAIAANVPDQLLSRITQHIQELHDVRTNFLKYRRKLILIEDKITELIALADDIQEEVSQLQQHLRDNLFVADKPALWNLQLPLSDIMPAAPKLQKAWHENAKTVKTFSRDINYFLLIFIIILTIAIYSLMIKRFRKLELTESDPDFKVIKRTFYDHPYSTFLFMLINMFIIFFTNMPLVLIGILGILLLTFAMKFLPGIIGEKSKPIVRIVLILYVLNFFEIVSWYFGEYARLYITGESLLAMILVFRYGIMGYFQRKNTDHPFIYAFHIFSLLLFVLFSIALLSNLFGFMNMAVLALKIGVKTSAIIVITFSAYIVLRSMILTATGIFKNGSYILNESQWDKVEIRSVQILNIVAVIFLIKFIFQTMEIYRPFMNWTSGFLTHDWVIGTLHITIGGILNLILILIVTFVVSRLLKFIIEDKLLLHSNLPKGVPAAISVTIRYFIIVLGILMALGAAGIDLSKFGLLAGALGVGIGFGLQNIVNNFISGLILVYERPVNVGDTVEVEDLMGTVNRIGIRSSNVRTYDGAEVVVPNGNLISNQLINWTLSDNQRRIEIKVGVAYGSDPNVVLELLKEVAMKHEDVLKNPEPKALFEEFGNSSLNFRLLCWVSFEKGLLVKSDIAIGIYNALAENNIEIPFPQVDLHVKKDEKERQITKDKDEKVKKD